MIKNKKLLALSAATIVFCLLGVGIYFCVRPCPDNYSRQSQIFRPQDFVEYPVVTQRESAEKIVQSESTINQNIQSAQYQIFSFDNGFSSIDLNKDGTADVVIKLYRNNGLSPHFAFIYSFSIVDESKDWSSTPIYKGTNGEEQRDIQTIEGADGTLKDIRIIEYKDSTTLLVIGKRDFGNSYADSRPVTFSFYKLEENNETDVPFGRPDYYFLYENSVKSKNSYIDVGEAFKAELPAILDNVNIK